MSGTPRPWSTAERPSPSHKLAGRTPGDPAADVVVYHGRRAGCATLWRRAGRALQVYRPPVTGPPDRLDVMIARRVDIVATADEDQAMTYRSRVARPPASVVVVGPGPDPWRPLIERFVGAEPDPCGDDPDTIRSDRPLHIGLVAERSLGDDLLVAAPGPSRPVERLTGSGPTIWHLLAAGHTIDEIVGRLAPADSPDASAIAAEVEAFATELVRSGLAVPA